MTTMTVQSGTPVFATGKFVQGLGGGGVYQDTTTAGGAAAFTVEAWIKPGTATTRRMAAGKGAGWWIGVMGLKPEASYKTSSAEQIIIGATALTAGTWYHLRLVADSSGARLYVNGVQVASNTTPAALPTSAGFSVGGAWAPGFDWPADGAIDEVRLSNVARNAADFTAPTEAFTADSSTLALYHLDGTADSDTGPAPTTVTPLAPTFTDASGTASDTYTIPTYTGVDYKVAAVTKAAGTYPGTGTVTVTAAAQAGYALTGTTSWSYTYLTAVTTPGAPGTVADPLLAYSPYNWTITNESAKTINTGAYLRFAASGNPSTMVLTFDTSANVAGTMPLLAFRVNGGAWATQSLAATITLDTATGNPWSINTVEMVVVSSSESLTRWATQQTQVNLTSIKAGAATPTFVAWDKLPLKGIAFGDSITEGINTYGANGLVHDSRLAWAYPLTQALGAEIGVVGFGLQGWGTGGHGGVPAFSAAWKLQWAGQARDFTTVPDFIVINQGTNQGTQAQIDATLRDILATVPTCPVIVLRPWNGARATEIQAAITAIGSTRLRYVDTTGWWATTDAGDGVHPYGHINLTSLTPKTAAAIRGALPTGGGVSNIFINRGGVAVALGKSSKA